MRQPTQKISSHPRSDAGFLVLSTFVESHCTVLLPSLDACRETFLDEAEDPAITLPGEVVVAGSPSTAAVCEVVDLVVKPVGTIVHLRLLPGTIEQYRRLLSRVGK